MNFPSKIVKGTAAVLACSVLLLLCSVSENDTTNIENVETSIPTTYRNKILSVNTSSTETGEGAVNGLSYPATSNANWDDLRPLAKELSGYVGSNGHGYTSYPFSKNHSGCTGYDSAITSQITITFNGVSHTVDALKKSDGLRSDCSGGVSAMLFFMGVTGSGNKIANTTAKSYCSAGADAQAATFGDLQVGDLLAKSTHVGMVAYKDAEYVYMFDWGCTSAINNCKSQGYDEKYELSKSISSWRDGTVYSRRIK